VPESTVAIAVQQLSAAVGEADRVGPDMPTPIEQVLAAGAQQFVFQVQRLIWSQRARVVAADGEAAARPVAEQWVCRLLQR
jgi:hypothetical protein